MRILSMLMALMLATPASAAPVTLVIVNTSQNTIESINTFPMGAGGAAVDDNVGSYSVPIAPGQAGKIELSLAQCQSVEVLVKLKDNDQEFRPMVDLCKEPVLTVGE